MNPVTPLNPQDNAAHDPGIVTAVLKIQYMSDLYCEYQAMARDVRGFKEFNPTFGEFLRSIKPYRVEAGLWLSRTSGKGVSGLGLACTRKCR